MSTENKTVEIWSPAFSSRYRPSKNVVRFYGSREKDAKPVRDIDVRVSTNLVLEAAWSGDYIELYLGSTGKGSQSERMYDLFFEDYAYKNDYSKKTALDGMSEAMWLFELDVVLIGEDKIEACISELIRQHNEEILRIRKDNMKI